MTAPLLLQTLGVPHVWVAGQPQALSGKSMALLMYLALEGPVHRELLTELLWTDKAGQGARGNLRQELYRLRGKLPGLALSVDGDWIGLSGAEVDVRQLRAHLGSGRWQQAAELVGGEFLRGLSPPAAEGFDEWREQQAEQIRTESLRALGEWAAELERRGDYHAALGVHERACSLDDLGERHHAAVIRLLLALGQREAARTRAERLEQVLRRELGVAPSPETRALSELAHAPQSEASLPLTGREEALYALSGSRVTLIVGEAGVGKTRLAQAAVARAGLTVQGLADLSSIPYAALAEALGSLPQAWPLPGTPERRALARLLPHTGEAEQPIPEDRALFVRLLSQVLSAALSGAALIVEDLHWLDTGTLDSGGLPDSPHVQPRHPDGPRRGVARTPRADQRAGRPEPRPSACPPADCRPQRVSAGPADRHHHRPPRAAVLAAPLPRHRRASAVCLRNPARPARARRTAPGRRPVANPLRRTDAGLRRDSDACECQRGH